MTLTVKDLSIFLIESSGISLAAIKKATKDVKCNVVARPDGYSIVFDEDDYWDFEEDNLTAPVAAIYNELSKITTVVRWDDRNELIVKNEMVKKPKSSPKQPEDPHKRQSNGLTANDEELIDLASSTTYRSSIRKYITMADTPKAKKILKDILNSTDVEWED